MVINPPNPPSVTFPSPNEWPETIFAISGITMNHEATITCNDHPFTTADQGVTTVIFLQVKGMSQINGLPGRIQNVLDADHFTVNINTTNFYPYTSAGVISIVTGQPPSETVSFQTFNTPFHNIA